MTERNKADSPDLEKVMAEAQKHFGPLGIRSDRKWIREIAQLGLLQRAEEAELAEGTGGGSKQKARAADLRRQAGEGNIGSLEDHKCHD